MFYRVFGISLSLSMVMALSCSPQQSTPVSIIGGSISGLSAEGLILRDADGDTITVHRNATSFEFPHGTDPSDLSISIVSQPEGLTCTVQDIDESNRISIVCSDIMLSVGGTISGLTATGLILRNNKGALIRIDADDTSFELPEPVAYGSAISIKIHSQPESQSCTITRGRNPHVIADISNVRIRCADAYYPVSGTISGLNASGLVLQNNGGDDLSIASGETTFEFTQGVLPGGSYAITVSTQPTGLACAVSNGSGSSATAAVTNVSILCGTPGGSSSSVYNNGSHQYFIGSNLNWLGSSGSAYVVGYTNSATQNGDSFTILTGGYSPISSSLFVVGGNFAVGVYMFICPVSQTTYSSALCTNSTLTT